MQAGMLRCASPLPPPLTPTQHPHGPRRPRGAGALGVVGVAAHVQGKRRHRGGAHEDGAPQDRVPPDGGPAPGGERGTGTTHANLTAVQRGPRCVSNCKPLTSPHLCLGLPWPARRRRLGLTSTWPSPSSAVPTSACLPPSRDVSGRGAWHAGTPRRIPFAPTGGRALNLCPPPVSASPRLPGIAPLPLLQPPPR